MVNLFLNKNAQKAMVELNKKYDEQRQIENEMKNLCFKYEQLKEDIEFLQLMIMHQSNKGYRYNKYQKKQ